MKIDNFADVLVFPGHQAHHGQAFLDVSAAYVCNIDNSVVPVDDAWQWLMPLFPDEPFDIGLRHWRGCFAVAGCAYPPPERSPVKHLTVSASVGGISKSLWVHGDRTWQKTGGVWQYSDVTPFASMPLDLAHAVGHKDWQENPHGIGYYANADEAKGQPVANIENVNQPMFSPNEPTVLATFLPLPSGTPTQNQWLGKIDEQWQKERLPWLPDDTDQRWYDRVSQDQCLPKETYWQGDESWQVTNMHPEYAELNGRLPGLRPRVFYRMKGNLEVVSELPVTLDTVWLFPNDQRVAVIYRGQLPVKFEDANDVERIGIFSEKMDAPALPLPQYQQQWLEKIGTEVNALARPLAAGGLMMPKAVAAGAVALSLAAATGAAAMPAGDSATASQADSEQADDSAKADNPAAEQAQAGDKAPQADLPEIEKNPEIAALDKAFDEGPEAFSQAMDQHFRTKFQNAIDEAKVQINEHGLDEVLKEHPLPTVDEVMARTPKKLAMEALGKAFEQGPEQFSQAMDQHFRSKFQTAIDEAKKQIDEHGLDEVLKDHPLPSVNEVMAKTATEDPAIAVLDKAFEQGAEQFSQVMDQHFRTKFQSAIDEAKKQIAEHGLEEQLKDHPLPSVNEIMKKG